MITALLCYYAAMLSQTSDIDRFLSHLDEVKTAKLTITQDEPQTRYPIDRNMSHNVEIARDRQYVIDAKPRYGGDSKERHGAFLTPEARFSIGTGDSGRIGVAIMPTKYNITLVPMLRDLSTRPLSVSTLHKNRLRLTSNRAGANIEIACPTDNGDSVVYSVDPQRGYGVVLTRILSSADGRLWKCADMDLHQYDNVWWWSHVNVWDDRGLLEEEFTVVSAEFNRPSHDQVLSLASIGLKPGDLVQDIRPQFNEKPLFGETKLTWDGNGLIPRSEYVRRVNNGDVSNPTWTPGDPTQADTKRLAAMHADMYERTAVFFARRNQFTDAQLIAAEGIADDVRAHNPAATQPAQKRKVIESSMLPRLQAMLTTKQAASAPSINRQRAEGPDASRPSH